LLLWLAASASYAQGRPMAVAATRATPDDLRTWDAQIDRMIRSRELRVAESPRDALLPERRHERLDQYSRGVRIFGGDITRQLASDGTVSLFGLLHADPQIDVTPRLSADAARGAIARAVSGEPFGDAELLILPLSDGYHLAYYGQATTDLEIFNVFVDATSGAVLRQYSDFRTEIGTGKGAYGDDKKVSARAAGGTFVADDPMRPSAITTYDMQGNLTRLTGILNRFTSVAQSDIASDSDNQWTDPTVVDAHVYAGWYYDYLFKRFGRRGIDDRELRMALFTHPVRQQDIATATPNVRGTYYFNAFFCQTCGPDGRGAIVFGEGAPRGFFAPGVEVKPFSAALDVVAHELTHAVTGATARLNGFPFSEGGSLNEAFSDVFGTGAAFFHETPGSAPLTATYLLGRDLTVPGGFFSRSLSNPAETDDADHYTKRFIGGDPHANGVILGHAFYLAIEGGTNRTSGLSVQGVGAANREQIEKAFFRALTVLLPSNATFALTRAATIQSARDLYGAGSSAERAITQAWDAVGVQPRVAPTVAMMPNPAIAEPLSCTASNARSWILGITISAGASNLTVSGVTIEAFDPAGRSVVRSTLAPVQVASFFGSCGPGSNRIAAQTDACSLICYFPAISSGTAQVSITATDDSNQTLTFDTGRVTLAPPR